MRVHLIGDTHFGRDMSRFGPAWVDHEARIERAWRERVAEDDVVLIPGDFSWATTTKGILAHLERIRALPGRAIVSRGNHCRFWKKTPRLDVPGIRFLDDDHVPLAPGWTVAASAGCDVPSSPWWEETMRPELERATTALATTLARAEADRPGDRLLLMLHYPPRWRLEDTPTAFERVIAAHPVEIVVYGHIHGVDLPLAHAGEMAVCGRSIRYLNGSADRIAMAPIAVMDLDDAGSGGQREEGAEADGEDGAGEGEARRRP